MNQRFGFALVCMGLTLAGQAAAEVTFYEGRDYQGRSFTTDGTVRNFARHGFNDRASSVVVKGERRDRWEVCEAPRFRGRCVVLRPGEYSTLAVMGLNNRISSVRAVDRRTGQAEPPTPPQAPPVASQIDFYEREGFQGRSFSANRPVPDFQRNGFNDRASSAVVTGQRWEVCQNTAFNGPCTVLRPGQYPSLAALGLNDRISSVRAVDGNSGDGGGQPPPPAAGPSVVLYENEGFQGRSYTATGSVEDFRRSGLNDRASSAVVSGGRWEACQDSDFGGNCVVLRPGQYPSLTALGMNDRISSLRAVGRNADVDERRYAPMPVVSRDYGRRNEERLFEANITSVRAVVEDAGRRCWDEPQQAPERTSNPNVPGALLGAVIGGILGHQVGGGTGKDVATGLGVVAGAAIGANTGRDRGGDQQVVTTQNVQRCSTNPEQARAAYWDVTYEFRGQEYRVQLNKAPGRTVTVNDQGEPRG